MKIVMCSKEAADKRAGASRAAVSFGLVNEQEESLSHGIVLCTQEQYEDYLMHYRRGGEKNGVRRWQNEDGSLTPEGYKHYADMYGWGKKLKKAEKLQDKADKAADKADKASRKADDDYVKAHNANRKNERMGTERSQEKADAANDKAELSKENAELTSVKARQAQRKASDYADKLQRKEDKMSKYVDENGDLNEKALAKYTYTTGVPGERKMSLVGRLKFGNEYANKFNEKNKNKMTKETKAWEEDEKKKFDEDNRKDNEMEDLRKQLKVSKYDELDENGKKALGDSVMNKLDEYEKTEKGSRRHERLGEAFTNFLYDKIGNDDMFETLSFTSDKIDSAYRKLSETTVKQRQRANEVQKDTGKSGESLSAALKSDLDWKKLDTDRIRSKKQLYSEILQELGFSNTAKNRDIVSHYMYIDEFI